jgi:two-component system, sensor histidine kinase and response regulator
MGRILIVDDHVRNIAILEKLLGPEHETASAVTGEQALELAPAFRPDLVLLDVMMPGIDGYETCRRMRAMPALASTKVLMVSARASVTERLAGYAAGADDYVVKPFDHDELVAKARVYLRLRSVEEVDRLKTELLSLISHETRTPLTTILSPIELLIDEPALSEEHRQLLAMAREGAHRIHRLIEKATTLGRLQSGAVVPRPGDHGLAALAREALVAARAAVATARVELVPRLDEAVVARCDPAMVREALDVLVENALQHGPVGSRVEVETGEDADGVWLAVRDHGAGVAPDFLPRIFDGFTAPEVRRHARGTGLSLAIARALVELSGGRLQAACPSDGGTRFTIRLPRPSDAAPAAGAAAPEAVTGTRVPGA